MSYSADTFVAGEQPTTAKWNKLWANDASFNDGTGIAAGAITPSKLSSAAHTAYVATGESTTSSSYVDLTTTTDTVTITIGANGLALVSIVGALQSNAGGSMSFMGFAISGATTLAASDEYAIWNQSYDLNRSIKVGATFLMTGLTPGSTTFKAKYRADSNQATISERHISVVPL